MQSLSYRTDGKSHLVSNRDILGFSVMDKAKPLEIISLYVDVILSNSMTLSLIFIYFSIRNNWVIVEAVN